MRYRYLLVAATLLAACAARDLPQADKAEIVFLDVGQGDAILIRSPEGKTALVDAGPGDILGALRRHGVDSIDIAIATHPHADHIGGMAAVIRNLPVRYYMDNGVPHTTAAYRRLMEALRASDVTYLEPTRRRISLGGVTLEVLPPPTAARTQNNRSVGLLVEYGEFRALLTGDSEVEELNYFLSLDVPDVTLLKAAHHGARDGVTPAWLNATRPEIVVISSGRGNPYGHPHPWALRYYRAVAKEVYRTDEDGEIVITLWPDGKYVVLTERTPMLARSEPVPPGGGLSAVGPAAAGAGLSLWVFADAPGNDHYNLNGEYVVLENGGAEAISIAGWTLCDAARHCYTFPAGAAVDAGGRVVVYTGSGQDGASRYYMNRRRAVWNNRGDVATLRDAEGRIVATYAY
jgi:competence protein ComEC